MTDLNERLNISVNYNYNNIRKFSAGKHRRGLASPAHEKAVEVLFVTTEGKPIVVLSQSEDGIRLP